MVKKWKHYWINKNNITIIEYDDYDGLYTCYFTCGNKLYIRKDEFDDFMKIINGGIIYGLQRILLRPFLWN